MHMCSFLKNGMMPIVQLTLVLVILSCSRISGEFCSVGFPENITEENSTMELDILPEDTEVIIPSFRMTCDGYISHVSVAYEVSHQVSSFNEAGVYLQLWRTSDAQAVGMQNYSLVEEVLLPVGYRWPDYDNQSILDNYELPVRITVQSNDIIGFRTLFGSPVEVLVDITEEREVLSNNDVLNVTGVPQVMLTNRKTCNSGLPNNINVSADAQRGFPVQSVSGNAQILFPSVNFTCNGVINQITSWYQITAGIGSNVNFINASIKFQIWHPISNSNYKLVSEATVPSALDDQQIAIDNLQLRFYSGSVIGIFIELIRHNGPVTLSLLTSDDTPQSFLLVTNTKPCTFDTTSPGVLRFTTIDAVAVLDYDIVSEDMDQIFLCDQDDDDDDSIVSSKKKIISAISAAVALVVTITLMILLGVCCWRRWKSSARTKSRYNLLPVENSDNLRSFENIQYYCLDSNPKVMSLSSKSGSYEVINDSTSTTSLVKLSASNFEQICSELTEVELNPDEIEIGDEIGSGHFGVVHRGVWNHSGKADQVAIKTLHDEVLEEERTKLLREAATVQQFLHINIIKFYGVITSRERIMVVLEYLPNGSLLDFLTSANSKKDEQLLPEILLTFAREIASGMNYLSNKSFIHRDLAARNVLLSEENVCKIADFGLSRDLDEDDYYIAHGGFIPVKWTAPEALLFRAYTTASDVWSYGVVLYEMWSLGERPYKDYDNSEISDLIGTGYRLPPPPGCARQIYNLMIQCWNPVHRLRPTFAAILKTISQPPYVLFHWFEEDKQAAGPQCDVLGAPLESGHSLFLDLQNAYK